MKIKEQIQTGIYLKQSHYWLLGHFTVVGEKKIFKILCWSHGRGRRFHTCEEATRPGPQEWDGVRGAESKRPLQRGSVTGR